MNENFYDGIDNAPELSNNSKNYIRPGVYQLRLTDFRAATRDYDQARFQVFEFEVVNVLTPTNESQGVGEKVVHMLNMSHPQSLSRIRQFVSVVADIPQKEVTASKCAKIAEEPNLVCGLEVIGNAYHIPKKSGGEFTLVDYRVIDAKKEEIPF